MNLLTSLVGELSNAYLNDNSIFDSYFELLDKDKFEYLALENAVQNAEYELLLDPARNDSWVAPLGMNNMKSLAKEMNILTKNPNPFDNQNLPVTSFVDRTYLNQLNETFLGRIAAIEIAVSLMSSHIQSQYKPITIPCNHFLLSTYNNDNIRTDLNSNMQIGGLYTEDGYFIPELINEVISLGTDVVKEHAMKDLGLSPQNMNLFLMLIFTQVSPKTALYIINNPLVKEYFANKSYTFISRTNPIIKQILRDRIQPSSRIRNVISKFSNSNMTPQEYFMSKLLDPVDSIALETVLVLEALFTKPNKAFAAAKFDTKGVGGKLVDGFLALQKVRKAVDKTTTDTYDMHIIEYLMENFGSPYQNNAYQAFTAISNIFPSARQSFVMLENELSRVNLDVKEKVYGDILTYKLFESISLNHNLIELRNRLMTGNNSVAKRVRNAKSIIKNDFLELLTPIISSNGKEYDYVKPNFYKIDTDIYNTLSYAWDSLHARNQQLAEDLVLLAILQSGFNRDSFSFLHLCPINVYNETLAKYCGETFIASQPSNISSTVILANNAKLLPRQGKTASGYNPYMYVGAYVTRPRYSAKFIQDLEDNYMTIFNTNRREKEFTYDILAWTYTVEEGQRYSVVLSGLPPLKGSTMNLQLLPFEVSKYHFRFGLANLFETKS